MLRSNPSSDSGPSGSATLVRHEASSAPSSQSKSSPKNLQRYQPGQTLVLLSLPAEMLLKIIEMLPYNNIFALMLTNRYLETLIRRHVLNLQTRRTQFIEH